jgi:hypothetical protein
LFARTSHTMYVESKYTYNVEKERITLSADAGLKSHFI